MDPYIMTLTTVNALQVKHTGSINVKIFHIQVFLIFRLEITVHSTYPLVSDGFKVILTF